jgi:hypothetical protein
MACVVAEVSAKVENGYPSMVASLPTPLRVRDDPVEAPQVCVLDICPWDSLAQFLTLPELEWLCGASAALHAEHTIEENVESDEADIGDTAGAQKLSKRKLLAPLLVLKQETAEMELERISLPNIRAIRCWKEQTLDMLRDKLSDAGGPQVLRSLERLKLSGCPLVEDVISDFIFPAFSHTQLRHLNLERNQVSDDVLCNLVKSGALDAGSLESMNLRFNMIGSKGAEALASSPVCASLKWVNLKMNRLGDDGAIALAEMLKGNSSMSLLNLRRQMPPLTNRAAIALAGALNCNSALEQLRLRQNKIGDEGAEALASEVAGHVKRLQVFRGFGTHFELDLEQNCIKDDGGKALLKSLEAVPRAFRVELLLHGNRIKRDSLTEADAGTGSTGEADPRLLFTSKAEEIL